MISWTTCGSYLRCYGRRNRSEPSESGSAKGSGAPGAGRVSALPPHSLTSVIWITPGNPGQVRRETGKE